MREVNKPTNLQIFLFFIGFVTLFTLMFVLGVVVGKGLNSRGLAYLDSKTAVLENGEEAENNMTDNEEIMLDSEDQIAEDQIEVPEENEQKIADKNIVEEEIQQPKVEETAELEAAEEAVEIKPAAKE
ncbi:MAG: hypothetical protein ACRENO_08315, partial [Thermodesulfobacteriota bacterium]